MPLPAAGHHAVIRKTRSGTFKQPGRRPPRSPPPIRRVHAAERASRTGYPTTTAAAARRHAGRRTPPTHRSETERAIENPGPTILTWGHRKTTAVWMPCHRGVHAVQLGGTCRPKALGTRAAGTGATHCTHDDRCRKCNGIQSLGTVGPSNVPFPYAPPLGSRRTTGCRRQPARHSKPLLRAGTHRPERATHKASEA